MLLISSTFLASLYVGCHTNHETMFTYFLICICTTNKTMAKCMDRFCRVCYATCSSENTKFTVKSSITPTKYQNLNYLSCSCVCSIHWNQVLSRERRCSWSSASKYVWEKSDFIAFEGATYIRGLAPSSPLLKVIAKYVFISFQCVLSILMRPITLMEWILSNFNELQSTRKTTENIPWICYERSFNEFYLFMWNQFVVNQRLQLFVQSPQPCLLIFAWRN